jgi:CelD/BcsL family acetyltransferase involved in cellulose biosynthesis
MRFGNSPTHNAQGIFMAISIGAEAGHSAIAADTAAYRYRVLHDIEDVAELWLSFERASIVSPGQSLALVRHWISANGILAKNQYFIVAETAAGPVALLPLWRQTQRGVRTLRFFPGNHVGANQPLVCPVRYAQLSSAQRRDLWRGMGRAVHGADLIVLDAVPYRGDSMGPFAEFGESLAAETLYRAEFPSFAEADRLQRSKSRRKHDRQQGEKLEAMGDVTLDTIGNGEAALCMLEVLFAQRARRFAAQGIRNPFAEPKVRRFYEAIAESGSGVEVVLHVLRLNGVPVALRYNIGFGGALYCLISSMSDDPAIQVGSPGKQCLLRVMQTVFDAGWAAFDMGAGFTDEKRHWCNVEVPLRRHYLALSPVGVIAGALDRGRISLKHRIKSDPKLLAAVRKIRARLSGRNTKATCESAS